jgi:hypothetical protein
MNVWPKLKPYCLLVSWLVSGCALMNEGGSKKPLPSNLIATPASYYSTAKARYLGNKYKDNLDRLTERIVRNSTTSPLQFANNISSVGGIGFFTHSATKTPDERYLEVVLATPETFETKGEYSDKVNQLFARYGQELLSILAGDSEIFQDKELAGYGLNLTWRNVIADAPANRVSLARAIIYFHKERVQNFLRRSVSQNELLGDAVIFAVEDDGPLNLVSYQPREIKPDFRPAIREDNLTAQAPAAKPLVGPTAASEGAKPSGQKPGAKVDPIKKDVPLAQAPNPPPVSGQPAAKVESPTVGVQAENIGAASRSLESANITAAEPAPAKRDSEPEKLALAKQPVEARSVKPVPEIILPKPAPANVTASAPKADRADSSKPPAAAVETVTKMPPVKPASAETTTLNPAEKVPTKPVEAKSIQSSSKPAEDTRTPTAPTPATKPVSPQPTPFREEATKTPESVAKPSETAEQGALPTLEKKIPISAPAVNKPEARKFAADAAPSVVPLVPNKAPSAPEKLVQKPAAIAEKPTVSPRSEIAQLPITKVPLPAGIKAVEPVKAVEEKEIDLATKPETRKSALDPAPFVVAAAPKEAPSAPDKPLRKPAAIAEKPVASPPAEIAPAPIAKMPSAAEVKAVEPVKVFEEKKIEAQNRSKISEPFAAKADALPTAVAAPEPVRIAEVKRPEPMVQPTAEKPAESVPARKAELVQPAPVAKAEIPESVKPMTAPVVLPNQEKPAPAPGQLALARKPVEPPSENPLLARPAPKPLHGFIIQVAFADKQKAQSWAEKMTQRGYAVSLTEAGAEGSLRVRLGNFSVRDDAERQLQSFKQEGMSGIIINLPQAFRPEARSSLP